MPVDITDQLMRVSRKNRESLSPEMDAIGVMQGEVSGGAPTVPTVNAPMLSGGSDFEFSELEQNPPSGGPTGIQVYYQDGTSVFLSKTNILANQSGANNWSVDFDVTGLEATKTVSYSTATALYVGTGDSQTAARIPVYRNGELVATYGAYQEGIRCVDGEPVVEFYKI